jgi:hypothetical protein
MMNLRRIGGRKFLLKLAVLFLLLLVSSPAVLAQDVNPQAVIPGSIQQGTWFEQWNQSGRLTCPNNAQRFITATNEAFTLSAPVGEQTLSIFYNTSRIRLYLARSMFGTYVHTSESSWWVHLIEVSVLSPTQMSVVSTFYAKDGTCTLTNQATWTFSSAPPPPTGCTVRPASVAVNKRSGPGLFYSVVGQLQPNTSATVISVAYDVQGRRWWGLSDNTWVSSVVTIAQGSCPS